MKMMRIRGVWTTNLAAFLLGAGMYSSFIILPQFAQLPTSTGFGFGASVVTSALYLLPAALGMGLLGTVAGRRRAPLRLQVRARRGHVDHRARVRVSAGGTRPPDRPADQRDAARNRDRAGVLGAREPDRHGRAARADGRRQRHEHGDADARRRARRSAFGDLHRRQHGPRPADRDRLRAVVRDGDRLPDRRCFRQPARARAVRRRGSRARARRRSSLRSRAPERCARRRAPVGGCRLCRAWRQRCCGLRSTDWRSRRVSCGAGGRDAKLAACRPRRLGRQTRTYWAAK